MSFIRVKLTTDELHHLDHAAKSKDVSRSDILRSRAIAARRYSPQQYASLVSRANRHVDMPRSQVERLVNFVFIEFMALGALEASPEQ